MSSSYCVDLLRTRSFGRLSLSVNALPVIEPVYFSMVGNNVVVRTHRDSWLATSTENAVVAFEVDELDPATGWGWSVLVQGLAIDASATTVARLDDISLPADWLHPVALQHFEISTDRISGRHLS